MDSSGKVSMLEMRRAAFWVIYFLVPLELVYGFVYSDQSMLSAGFIAAILSHLAGTLYNIGLYKKRITPDNVAWWILGFAGILFTWSHIRLGGLESGGLFIISTFDMLATAIIATWFHRVKIVRGPVDSVLLVAVLLTGGICLSNIWQDLDQTAFFWVLIINMCVDFLGMLFNLINALRPMHEKILPWVVTCAACAVNLLAAHWAGVSWVLPLYFFAINMLMLAMVLIGKFLEVRKLFSREGTVKILERTIVG